MMCKYIFCLGELSCVQIFDICSFCLLRLNVVCVPCVCVYHICLGELSCVQIFNISQFLFTSLEFSLCPV